jgi:hypothetical protein
MILRFWIVFLGIGMASGLRADETVPFPKHVPPVVGTAVVTDQGNGSEDGVWKVRVTVPKSRWIYDGDVIVKIKGESLAAEVEREEVGLILGGPFQKSPSQFFDVKGNTLKKDEVLNRLKKKTAVLLSVSNSFPDAYYLQVIKPDTIIIVIGYRDGSPLPDLLPAEKRQ